MEYHYAAVPYMNRIDTFGLYCVAYFSEVFFTLISSLYANIVMALLLMITNELNNIVVGFCERMQSTSRKYEITFGLYCDSPDLLRQFDRDMASLIKEHQLICR